MKILCVISVLACLLLSGCYVIPSNEVIYQRYDQPIRMYYVPAPQIYYMPYYRPYYPYRQYYHYEYREFHHR